jgi:hypothetical protein
VSRAVRSWHDAYVAVQPVRSWEGFIEVGDAYRRIGDVARTRATSAPKARELYLTAFFRARRAGSLDGMLRAAESFAALGDRDVAEQCLHAAERLAAEAPRESDIRVRVAMARRRIADRLNRGDLGDEPPVARLLPGESGAR